jgi:lactoylglutathione lyase
MEESLKFYKEIVGLEEKRRFAAGPGMEITFLGEGDTEIELICDANKVDLSYGKDISLGFQVESVDEMHALLQEKGVPVLSGMISPNPHTKFFFAQDPNGVKVQFAQMM